MKHTDDDEQKWVSMQISHTLVAQRHFGVWVGCHDRKTRKKKWKGMSEIFYRLSFPLSSSIMYVDGSRAMRTQTGATTTMYGTRQKTKGF